MEMGLGRRREKNLSGTHQRETSRKEVYTGRAAVSGIVTTAELSGSPPFLCEEFPPLWLSLVDESFPSSSSLMARFTTLICTHTLIEECDRRRKKEAAALSATCSTGTTADDEYFPSIHVQTI